MMEAENHQKTDIDQTLSQHLNQDQADSLLSEFRRSAVHLEVIEGDCCLTEGLEDDEARHF